MILVVHPGSGSWFLPIPDPGFKKARDPGSGSATLKILNADMRWDFVFECRVTESFTKGGHLPVSFTTAFVAGPLKNPGGAHELKRTERSLPARDPWFWVPLQLPETFGDPPALKTTSQPSVQRSNVEKSIKEIGNIFAINTNMTYLLLGRRFTIFIKELVEFGRACAHPSFKTI